MKLFQINYQQLILISSLFFFSFISAPYIPSKEKKQKASINVREYTVAQLPEKYAMALATETMNLRTVNTRSRNYNILMATDVAYMLINGRFEALPITNYCENCPKKIVQTYQNAKYRVQINANYTQDPNCPLEGGCLDIKGKLTVTDKNTGAAQSFNIWGEG